jgi:hypothetical protein
LTALTPVTGNLSPLTHPDSWDEWVNQREHYLAERLRFDVQYYDNNIWGAEDLYAYGDWTYAGDYGWIWRPHASVISGTQTGALSLRQLGLDFAIWLDLDRRRAMGLGALPLRTLGLLQQLLGLVSARSLLSP